MRIINYRIESEPRMDELQEVVNKLISEGWQPLGGVSVGACAYYIPETEHFSGERETIFYCQALAFYE